MKRICFFSLLMTVVLSARLDAQCVIYPSLKSFLEQDGDTVEALCVEKRTRNQIMLTGGADYRVSADENNSLSRRLKRRTFAIRTGEGDLYLNCRKMRYKKMRFGAWYAPAVKIGDNLFFSAVPLGSVVGGQFVSTEEVKLGGQVGDAIATSSLVNKRVCYELDTATGKVEFLDRERMLQLLDNYPEYKEAYLNEESPESKCTFKYLLLIQGKSRSE
ncbi:MAG: hypothetical protein LBN29_12675 [Mediterranea sp.]|nr:hypothetical protein [Mediterranea sp.]